MNKSSTIHSIDRQKSYIHFNGLKSLKTSYLYKKSPQGLDRQKKLFILFLDELRKKP